jgi:hypothetical protein
MEPVREREVGDEGCDHEGLEVALRDDVALQALARPVVSHALGGVGHRPLVAA